MVENSQQTEVRQAPAAIAPVLPDNIRIAVPRPFQDYVIRRQSLYFWVIFTTALLVPASFMWPHLVKRPTDPTYYLQLVMELMVYLVWRDLRRKTWYYEFGPIDAKLISLGKFERGMRYLKWRENNYVAVARGEWNGLPMITITRRSAYFWEPKKMWLVYSPENSPVVEQVVPFMAKRGTLTCEGAWYRSQS